MKFARIVIVASIAAAVVAPLGASEAAQAIRGGTPVAGGEFPWMVRLEPVNCGGTLIAKDIVLTAAHCVPEKSGANTGLTAVTGVTDLKDPRRTVSTSTHTYRPAGEWYEADWGLVKLAAPLDAPVVKLAATTAYDNGRFTVVGWGKATWNGPQQRHLKKADVPFLADASCRKMLGPQLDPRANICASTENGKSHCGGDSGGPLLRRLPDASWLQVGVVSWGSDCEASGHEALVHTQVSAFVRDIRREADRLRSGPADS